MERNRYHQLFELTPYCYLVTDKLGIIKNANQTASTLLSIEKQYLIGKPIIVFIAPKYRQQFTCQIADFQPQQESPEPERPPDPAAPRQYRPQRQRWPPPTRRIAHARLPLPVPRRLRLRLGRRRGNLRGK